MTTPSGDPIQGALRPETAPSSTPEVAEPLVAASTTGKQLGQSALLEYVRAQHADNLRAVAPDMREFADTYSAALFQRLSAAPAFVTVLRPDQVGLTPDAMIVEGLAVSGEHFYRELGRDKLGPIATHFVMNVLQGAPAGSTVAFPARDAEVFYEIALELNANPEIAAKELRLIHPTVNRRTLGVQDEMSGEAGSAGSQGEPLFMRYLAQEGFFNPKGLVLADVGCWGTMVHKILEAKQKGGFDVNLQGVYFLFSHLPQIHGYMNQVSGDVGAVDSRHLEAVADSFEALPRSVRRSTTYAEAPGGRVAPDYSEHRVDSPFLDRWKIALFEGAREAARSYVADSLAFPSPSVALITIQAAHILAQQGDFTGIFGHNTPTWSEGETWRANWGWGPVAPVRSSDLH